MIAKETPPVSITNIGSFDAMKPSFRWLLVAVFSLLFLHSASAHYDPRLGRWLTRDPIGEEGGFNRYAYCGNDPVNRSDPLGLDPKYDTPFGLAYGGWTAMGSPQWDPSKGGYFVPMRFIVSIPMRHRDYMMPLADAQERAPYNSYITGFIPQARPGLGTPNGIDFGLMHETLNSHPGFRAQMAIFQGALLAVPGGYGIGLVSRIPYANAVMLPLGSAMLGKEIAQIATADTWAERADRAGGLLGGGSAGKLTFNAGQVRAAKLAKWVSGFFEKSAGSPGLRPLTPWYAKEDGAIFPGNSFPSAGPIVQPRNILGQFAPKSPGQMAPGLNAVDDFVNKAQSAGFEIVAREVSFRTPFGLRRYDVVLRNSATGATSGIEIKSSTGAMNRWDADARQQFAADRWINMNGGATSVGNKGPITIESTYKVQW